MIEKYRAQFQEAALKLDMSNKERVKIGTLGEKTIHALLKDTFEPDNSNHEVKIGNFHVDILNSDGIFEIQTGNFNTMRNKLNYLLKDYTVTIIYPIMYQKWIVWIDEQTGEITKKRKSPKTGTQYEAFFELYKIKQFLNHPNLKFCLVLIDATEYRNLNGWSHDKKRGSSRFDRIPEKMTDIIFIDNIEDYSKLIPPNLPELFSSKDFKKASRLSLRSAQISLNVLNHIGAIKKIGKKGNLILYELTKK